MFTEEKQSERTTLEIVQQDLEWCRQYSKELEEESRNLRKQFEILFEYICMKDEIEAYKKREESSIKHVDSLYKEINELYQQVRKLTPETACKCEPTGQCPPQFANVVCGVDTCGPDCQDSTGYAYAGSAVTLE